MTMTLASPLALVSLGTGEPALQCISGWRGDRAGVDPVRRGLAQHHITITGDPSDRGDSPETGSDPGTNDVDTAVVVDALPEAAGADLVVPVSPPHAGWVGIERRHRRGAERAPAPTRLPGTVLEPPAASWTRSTGRRSRRAACRAAPGCSQGGPRASTSPARPRAGTPSSPTAGGAMASRTARRCRPGSRVGGWPCGDTSRPSKSLGTPPPM